MRTRRPRHRHLPHPPQRLQRQQWRRRRRRPSNNEEEDRRSHEQHQQRKQSDRDVSRFCPHDCSTAVCSWRSFCSKKTQAVTLWRKKPSNTQHIATTRGHHGIIDRRDRQDRQLALVTMVFGRPSRAPGRVAGNADSGAHRVAALPARSNDHGTARQAGPLRAEVRSAR